jgi:FkbM family methyltransferase
MPLSSKTRVLNVLRAVFKAPPLERWLARKTVGRPPASFWCRLLPNPYQYEAPAWRVVERDGVRLRVDITDFMGYVYYFGIETESYATLFDLCRPGDVVVDIGVNIGWTLLNFARRSGSGSVIGFEPDPFNFAQCTGNLALNQFANVTLLPYGLGDRPGQVTLDAGPPSNRGGHRVAPGGAAGSGAVIQIKKLDDVDIVATLPRLDLMKIDVEGYELKVLTGASAVLRRHHPTVFVEIDDRNLRDQGDSPGAVIAFLVGLGYTSIRHAGTGAPLSAADEFGGCHFDLIARPA